MKTTQHTPTPWKDVDGILTGPNGEDVGMAENEKVNQEFMLRAVNSHEELLAAAEHALTFLIGNFYGNSGLAEKLRKAIALSEVKP